ncbi:MAG: L-2-amino-thiazoline-4-carboxylic acid hydrolase [Pseudomonadota bacterium]
MSKTDLPMLEQRRIEANILKPVYEEMRDRLGKEAADEILGAAVIRNSIEQGQAYADGLEDTGLLAFRATMAQWKASGALEMEMLKETDAEVHFNVTRCRYSEMYREMGLGEIGHLLSCNRDGTFCTGFNPAIKLERSQTIMQGASHCDFRYRFEPEEG